MTETVKNRKVTIAKDALARPIYDGETGQLGFISEETVEKVSREMHSLAILQQWKIAAEAKLVVIEARIQEMEDLATTEAVLTKLPKHPESGKYFRSELDYQAYKGLNPDWVEEW